ncbi:DNA polymerase III subunit alpha [bacterium]|nr:DNA polymerase III subunit alpha [bacterium]
MSESPSFVHLRVRSSYSLLQSMIRPKDLAAWAKSSAAPAVCVMDPNLFGALDVSEALTQAGVQSITGLCLAVRAEGDGAPGGEIGLIAQSEEGYRNLMALSTRAFLDAGDDEAAVSREMLRAHSDGLICLTGGREGPLTKLASGVRAKALDEQLSWFAGAFPERLYVELRRDGLADEIAAEGALIDAAYRLGLPIVASSDVRFVRQDQHPKHDALLCIAHSAYVSQRDRPRASPDQWLTSADDMAQRFADLPEALENSLEIARRCAFRPKGRAPILPRFETAAGRNEAEELAARAREGLERRLADGRLFAAREEYDERLAFELSVIEGMGFPGYFLIVADFIGWAKSQRIPVGPGRGSGAGSLVAWALTITDLDPIRFGLLFERFLNPERVSMPDFDVDFCQDRREEVINYVRDRYGADHVSQIITFGTLQARAVLRDVGRVLQLPFGKVDRLAKLVPFNPASPPTLAEALESEPALRQARDAEEDVSLLIDTALDLEGLYRNASTHAAGVVIADRPLVELSPLYKDPRSDIPATQFNMKWAEHAGLVKFDFLGLKTLTVIQKALQFIESEGRELGNGWETLDNKAAYELMASGLTLGVFQLEGQGMRDTLKKVRPGVIEDVIALISLYRPGPMKNIDTYVDAKFGRRDPDYLHPDLEPVLKETYGVIVYQEQVMKIAQILAGYSLGEADLLRRAMGKKKPEEMAKQKTRFLEGAAAKGVPEARAAYIFELVSEFAGYGFNKSHAAAYAVIAYQTAFLKANHPAEFLAASMSLDIGNTDKLAAFFQDARRLGVKVAPPDILRSRADFHVEGQTVLYALGAIKGVGVPAMTGVERERASTPFESVEDFASRVDPRLVNKRCIEQLVRAGALDALNPHRASMLAGAGVLTSIAAAANDARTSRQESLFGDARVGETPLPSAPPWSEAERLDHELGSIGFYMSGHPLDDLMTGAARDTFVLAADREAVAMERTGFDMVGVVRRRVEKMSQSGGKFAYVTLSDPSGEYEVMAPPEVLETDRELLEVGSRVVCRMRVRRKDEEVRFSIESVRSLKTQSLGSHEALCVRLSRDAPLDHVADVAHALRDVRSRVAGSLVFELPIDEERVVTISIGGRFAIDYGAVAALKAAPGVEQVRPLLN